MTTRQLKMLRGAVLVAAVVGMVGGGPLALARGFGGGGFGGGFHDGGGFRDDGFSGGSFRDNSATFHDGGFNDDRFVDVNRYGDSAAAVRGPDGSFAARGPGGDYVARGPDGGVVAGGSNRGWGGYYGAGWGGAVAAGAVAGLAVGAMVSSLPLDAEPISVADQRYYVADDIYYQPCYQGAVVNYCVVDNPN